MAELLWVNRLCAVCMTVIVSFICLMHRTPRPRLESRETVGPLASQCWQPQQPRVETRDVAVRAGRSAVSTPRRSRYGAGIFFCGMRCLCSAAIAISLSIDCLALDGMCQVLWSAVLAGRLLYSAPAVSVDQERGSRVLEHVFRHASPPIFLAQPLGKRPAQCSARASNTLGSGGRTDSASEVAMEASDAAVEHSTVHYRPAGPASEPPAGSRSAVRGGLQPSSTSGQHPLRPSVRILA